MKQKISTIKEIICTKDGEKLWFANKTDGSIEIYNKIRNELIGKCERLRCGKFMHWCFSPEKDTFFTNGCLKEISNFITKLYTKKDESKI